MSKFKKTIKSEFYWIAKGQGEIYKMLEEQINERGDAAKLAKKIGKTPGYISQILNGESDLNPTWKKIVKFCLALNKVPVLELKDSSEYLAEQRLKASFAKCSHLNISKCDNEHAFNNAKELELTEFSEFVGLKKRAKFNLNKTKITLEEPSVEFEYI